MSFMSIAPRPQNAVVGDLAGEGVYLPVFGVGRNHVEVAMDEEGGPVGVFAFDPGDHAGALGVRLQDRGLQADLGELGGGVLGGLALAGAGVVARVRGVDPDQVAADVDDLVLRGHWVRCHLPIVALGVAGLRAGPAGWACAGAAASGIGWQGSLARALAWGRSVC